MIYCTYCGTLNSDIAKFCKKCGKQIESTLEQNPNQQNTKTEGHREAKRTSSARQALLISFLSIPFPGIGHWHLGFQKKAVILAIFMPVVFFSDGIIYLIGHYINQAIVLGSSVAMIAFYLYVVIDTYRLSKTTISTTPQHRSIFFAISAIVYLFIFVYLIPLAKYNIPANSMANTILKGDKIFSSKLNNFHPFRGDIVIFRYPNNPKQHYVKRCVALPGDEIFVTNKVFYLHPREGNQKINTLFPGYEIIDIDGKKWVKDPYTKEHPGIHHDDYIVDNGLMPREIFNFGPVQVPDKEYFMMGDNRDHSNDSRFWGAVPQNLLIGKALFIYSSEDESNMRWERIGEDLDVMNKAKLNL